MAKLEDIVRKQKPGATFVISAQMLQMSPREFDALAQVWDDEGGPGFNVAAVPFRVVVEDEFFISRVTVVRTTAEV
ncbi:MULTISPECIES: hypothetical protein [Herbaspirillum]|uniref:Uncharacterized protein n=1 Tax=Herbaspirillum seropedicae (strain SmR1) TaxID=757424 RepID=D8IRT5_HERSS|nr:MULTISPECIES: hypothetical protein [Herbaspirillum]ADJ65278.1 conserved hypothetical protein [Herbaspirillum seropedicae SmR1]AKN67129.1 hypothetical protein ACP92_18960 [Herbaspirillum seropedicae]AON56176.1 hypothetical protein Hsc_3910 [Herbaspirillum seropedicae]MDR6398143.1 hypothetical protein [Herbaspirillum seropedicae]NQE30270.1 hypothetical protein [Herbaspirillum seropedicae]